MKAFSQKHFAALIGIDWADKKHDICEYSHTTKRYSFSIISSKPEAIHEWANDLKKRYPNQRIAVSCELKKGPARTTTGSGFATRGLGTRQAGRSRSSTIRSIRTTHFTWMACGTRFRRRHTALMPRHDSQGSSSRAALTGAT